MKKNVAIYYINLDRSEERNSQLLHTLKDFNYDIHRISAVDGKNLTYEDVPEYMYEYREKYHTHLTFGEIACTLSHKKALKEFLQSDYDYAIILEDDAIITPQLNTLLEHIESVRGWDIIKLENRKIKAKDQNYKVKEIEDLSLYIPKYVHWCSLAIMYTKIGAEKVLAMNEEIYYAFDTQFRLAKKYDIKYLAVTPNLFVSADLESEIGHENKKVLDKNILHKYRRRNIRLYQSIEKSLYQKQLYAYFKEFE